jgi:hypothetical protein
METARAEVLNLGNIYMQVEEGTESDNKAENNGW